MIIPIEQIDDIKAIRIKLTTNNNKYIDLKANTFVFADGKTISGEGEGYPFVCLVGRVYNSDYFKDKSHFERVQVFFNKKAFEKFLSKCVRDETIDVSRDNMLVMLNVLFPITFPIEDRVTSVFDDSISTSFVDTLKNLFLESGFAYLNVDTPCTVTQVIWLDTLDKNPTYVELTNLFFEKKLNVVKFMQEKSKKGAKSAVKGDPAVKAYSISLYEKDVKDMSQYISRYKNGDMDETEMLEAFSNYKERSYLWWKMYFLFANLKKNTSVYKEFVKDYLAKFVGKTNSNYYMTDRYDESLFQDALSDMDFYFEYLKKLEFFLPPYRESMNPDIAHLFREEENRKNIDIDQYLLLFRDRDNVTGAGIDTIKESKTKSNEWYYEVKQVKSSVMYEIQLLVSLVEGIVDSNSGKDRLCQLKFQKLVKDSSVLAKYKPGQLSFYPYISMKELSSSKDVMNSKDVVVPDQSTILKSIGGRRRKRTHVQKKRRRNLKTRKR